MSEIKETIDKTEEMARQIWLAGLGAYGQSVDNIQHGYDKMNDQTRKFFEELVQRGEELENGARDIIDDAQDRIKERAGALKEKAQDLTSRTRKSLKVDNMDLNLQKRLSEIRSKVSDKVSLPRFGNETKLAELQAKLDELTAAVDALKKAQSGPVTAKRAPAKSKKA